MANSNSLKGHKQTKIAHTKKLNSWWADAIQFCNTFSSFLLSKVVETNMCTTETVLPVFFFVSGLQY